MVTEDGEKLLRARSHDLIARHGRDAGGAERSAITLSIADAHRH
jgi:hypothetical protein